MKSGKQRRQEIKALRIKRAKASREKNAALPPNRVAADPEALAHNNSYGPFPQFYVDQVFRCEDCAVEEVWTAKNQKWWYEIAKGNINSRAVRCRKCRKARREVKAQQKQHMDEMARREPHPHEAFFRKTESVSDKE